MGDILPFRGIRYNPKRIQNLSKVISPPYDIITKEDQSSYYHASPYNVIRLELGKRFSRDDGMRNCYTRARTFFEKWLSRGVLIQDVEPSIYIYEQKFKKGKRWVRRLGFIALLELTGSRKYPIFPHEETFDPPKEDRLQLMKALKANTSPLFFLFSDRRKEVDGMMKRWIRRTRPIGAVSHDEEWHTLWRLTDPSLIEKLRRTIRHRPLFIADGHHRYEVARAYAHQFVMAYFSNLLDEHLTILPIHRLVKGLDGNRNKLRKTLSSLFAFKPFRTVSALLEAMEKNRQGYVFGMVAKGGPVYLMSLKGRKVLSELDDTIRRSETWRRLDVTVLHEILLKKGLGLTEKKICQDVCFLRDLPRCLDLVDRGEYQVAFLLRAPRIEQVQRIALSGEKMPQKSTYFYPKPLTGLVMYRFNNSKVKTKKATMR
ncbi:MAG: DUF1015 domain-containing protein [Candidatus Omnitrophica bacterium]|nr:DUF1015 domain-containing protein [Candidatus Omnitrophota bacterium]